MLFVHGTSSRYCEVVGAVEGEQVGSDPLLHPLRGHALAGIGQGSLYKNRRGPPTEAGL